VTLVLLVGLGGGARGMQPSIADENTRQCIVMKYIPPVFVKQDNKKCRNVVNEQKFRKLGSCWSVPVLPVYRPMSRP